MDANSITQKTTIFEGPAKEAVTLFPANINVAALLSLVGLGSTKTLVKIVADPGTDKNTHQIEAKGKFGKITIHVENVPDHTNPKTSRLAILSAIECLRAACTEDSVPERRSGGRRGACAPNGDVDRDDGRRNPLHGPRSAEARRLSRQGAGAGLRRLRQGQQARR